MSLPTFYLDWNRAECYREETTGFGYPDGLPCKV